jgi:hypothetical protein
VQNDRIAGASERQRNGSTNATTRAGDQRSAWFILRDIVRQFQKSPLHFFLLAGVSRSDCAAELSSSL